MNPAAFYIINVLGYCITRILKFWTGGFILPPVVFSNLISTVLAALTLAQAIMIPLGNTLSGETATALPVVAPVTATAIVEPVLAGIDGILMFMEARIIPAHCVPL